MQALSGCVAHTDGPVAAIRYVKHVDAGLEQFPPEMLSGTNACRRIVDLAGTGIGVVQDMTPESGIDSRLLFTESGLDSRTDDRR
jgi:hypothetical protein